MKIIKILWILVFVLFFGCSQKIDREINQEDLHTLMDFLASDSLKGRYPGTPEDSVLLHYITSQFEKYGLSAPAGGYIQNFELTTGVDVDPVSSLRTGSLDMEFGKDFYPMGFSSGGSVSAPVLFAGYGIVSGENTEDRNDYLDIEPAGKWLIILRGSPDGKSDLLNYSRDRDKVMYASDKGAAGVLLVAGEKFSIEDRIETHLDPEPSVGIPVIQVTRSAIEKLMKGSDLSIPKIENYLQDHSLSSAYISNEELTCEIKISKVSTMTGNVIGLIEGSDPVLKDEWIVVGAHHDHLGMGGSSNSSRMPDTIAVHNGADDNASGVAAVLELASRFSSTKHKHPRSLAFITFGAEEKGLVGSKYFVENMPFESSALLAMVNIDMLGRMKPDSLLQVSGVGTSAEASELLEKVNENYHLNLTLTEAGFGPSDHASFYMADIPVFFFTTGPHKEYHTPLDDIDSINFKGLEIATSFIADLIDQLGTIDSLTFREAGPKVSSGRSYRGSVTLGIMPDVSGGDTNGLKVLAVTEGRPGSTAGLKKGDIIIGIDNHVIGNIYDYMYRLKSYKPGDSVVITILRNEKEIDLLVYF